MLLKNAQIVQNCMKLIAGKNEGTQAPFDKLASQ